jgi:hypothetical protein
LKTEKVFLTEEQVQSENVLKTEKIFFERGRTENVLRTEKIFRTGALPEENVLRTEEVFWTAELFRTKNVLRTEKVSMDRETLPDSKCLAYRGSLLDR